MKKVSFLRTYIIDIEFILWFSSEYKKKITIINKEKPDQKDNLQLTDSVVRPNDDMLNNQQNTGYSKQKIQFFKKKKNDS